MDFDLIDAQGSAAIMTDGGKLVTVTLPGGFSRTILVFVDHETIVTPSGYDNFKTELRTTVTGLLADLPNNEPLPKDTIIAFDRRRYIVDDSDSLSVQDEVIATHIVRELSNG